MTTTTPETTIEEHPDIRGLDNGQAEPATASSTATPRRRGRPKGSRNKPRETAPAASKPTPVPPVSDAPPAARAVLIEDGTLTLFTEKGLLTFTVEPQFILDRRK
jgi:hypothetical protein